MFGRYDTASSTFAESGNASDCASTVLDKLRNRLTDGAACLIYRRKYKNAIALFYLPSTIFPPTQPLGK